MDRKLKVSLLMEQVMIIREKGYVHGYIAVRKATIIERQMSKEPKPISWTFHIVYLSEDFQSSFEDGSWYVQARADVTTGDERPDPEKISFGSDSLLIMKWASL